MKIRNSDIFGNSFDSHYFKLHNNNCNQTMTTGKSNSSFQFVLRNLKLSLSFGKADTFIQQMESLTVQTLG